MLGALSRWLRALGFDTAYDPALDDPELVAFAHAEGRTILTRDRRLTERRLARNHLLIRSDVVDEQVRQVLEDLGLRADSDRLFRRCLRCNTPLEPVDPEAARARVPPWVARTQQESTGAARTWSAWRSGWSGWECDSLAGLPPSGASLSPFGASLRSCRSDSGRTGTRSVH